MSLFGTDQSRWQKNTVTERDFVILKATEGAGYVDPTCDEKYQLNKVACKLLGVYHFARPDLNSAEDEAKFFVDNVKGYLHEAILCLDWEQPGTQGSVMWAKCWLDKVYELTGVKPLIYMSASVVTAYNWTPVAEADYGLWIAGYPDLRDSWELPDFPYSTGAWRFCALWQYTNSGGKLDRDVFYGNELAWRKYAGAEEKEVIIPSEAYLAVDDNSTDIVRDVVGNDEQYYIIQPGDTLSELSDRFNVDLTQLCVWNDILDPNMIYAGNRLRVK